LFILGQIPFKAIYGTDVANNLIWALENIYLTSKILFH